MVSLSLASLGNTWRLRAEVFENGFRSHRRAGGWSSSLISLDLISIEIYYWLFCWSYGYDVPPSRSSCQRQVAYHDRSRGHPASL
jgi:hypothetical protein